MKKTLPIGEIYRYFRTSKNFALKGGEGLHLHFPTF